MCLRQQSSNGDPFIWREHRNRHFNENLRTGSKINKIQLFGKIKYLFSLFSVSSFNKDLLVFSYLLSLSLSCTLSSFRGLLPTKWFGIILQKRNVFVVSFVVHSQDDADVGRRLEKGTSGLIKRLCSLKRFVISEFGKA
jgi:hypothetical protein